MDNLANSLTIIRNALISNKSSVKLPFSNLIFKVMKVLETEGFIESVSTTSLTDHKSVLNVILRKNVIHEIKLVSKQSRRFYLKKKNINKVKNGFGTSILTTNKGILSGKQARLQNVGGEVLMEVW